MRRIALPLAAAALAATAPLALGSNGPAGLAKPPAVTADASTGYQSHAKATTKKAQAAQRRAKAERRKRARRAKPVNLVLTACAVDDATASSVALDALAGNAHMRRLLGGADAFTAQLGTRTRVVLSEAARADRGVEAVLGSPGDIWAGDRVVVRWRAKRGTTLAALPAALRVVNQGPHDECLPAVPEEELPEEGAAWDGALPEQGIEDVSPDPPPAARPAPDDDCDDDDHDDDDEDDDDDHGDKKRRGERR